MSESPLPRGVWSALFHPWVWRMAWRDSRSQRLRLAIFSLAIVSGIASLVAIHGLKENVQRGIDAQAKALLGSDMQVTSRQAIPAENEAELAALATRTSRETTFSSMLYFPAADGARLVQVRGLDGDYPYYGTVETEPADAWRTMKEKGGVLVEAALLDQFGAKTGDRVRLGDREFTIAGVVTKPAPRTGRFAGFAPEIYLRHSDLGSTGLLGVASMSSHALHLELPPGTDAQKLRRSLREDFPERNWRIDTPENRRENLGDALDNFQQYLGLIALASLVLGAIGVAAAVHAHVSRRVPTVAILRCLGCPGHVAFTVFLAQAAALGIFGAALGTLLGVGIQSGVLAFFRDSLPIEIAPEIPWAVVSRTAAAGFAVCCGFALLPLLRVRRISPAATLRDGAALSGRSWSLQSVPVYIVLAALLTLLAVLSEADEKRALVWIGALAGAFGILAVVARLLTVAARKIVRPRWPYLLRQGISNLHRPHNQTLLFLLSLGLGTFLLVTILMAGRLLQQRLNLERFAESPNVYLVDVQPDQVDGVGTLLRSKNLPVLESAPMVTMRIQSVRGTPVRELENRGEIPRWAARREFRSTYRNHLNPTETVTAGTWHGEESFDPSGPVPVSLEEEIARDLRVSVGDGIVMDVQGIPVSARVTSLRKVDWSRFNLNFFMIFPPGVLEDAPGFHVVTTRVPDGVSSGDLQRDLVKDFANVSAIDLTLILETVRGILGKISGVVSLLAGFTALAALPILIGTLLNSRDLRLRESVLLRTLGASSRQVRAILVVEYATLGLLSALTGLTLAIAANAGLAKFAFKASPWPAWDIAVWSIFIVTGLAVAGGMALSRGVCGHPPLEILRSGA